jgi:hypothetical protein
MKEICLGTRPPDERAFATPGEPYYRELVTIDALAYRRMLDRVFWHPPVDLLRFEVQATPSHKGSEYLVVAYMQGAGMSWFDIEGIPGRWDTIATFEISWSVTQLHATHHGLDPVEFEKAGGKPGRERMPDYASLQDPAETARYRAAVVRRLIKAGASLEA